MRICVVRRRAIAGRQAAQLMEVEGLAAAEGPEADAAWKALLAQHPGGVEHDDCILALPDGDGSEPEPEPDHVEQGAEAADEAQHAKEGRCDRLDNAAPEPEPEPTLEPEPTGAGACQAGDKPVVFRRQRPPVNMVHAQTLLPSANLEYSIHKLTPMLRRTYGIAVPNVLTCVKVSWCTELVWMVQIGDVGQEHHCCCPGHQRGRSCNRRRAGQAARGSGVADARCVRSSSSRRRSRRRSLSSRSSIGGLST